MKWKGPSFAAAHCHGDKRRHRNFRGGETQGAANEHSACQFFFPSTFAKCERLARYSGDT